MSAKERMKSIAIVANGGFALDTGDLQYLLTYCEKLGAVVDASVNYWGRTRPLDNPRPVDLALDALAEWEASDEVVNKKL